MASLPANILAVVFDFLPIEEAASVSGAKRFKYRRIFQACVQGRRLFMQTSYQNQLALVRDIEIEYASLFASFRVVARMSFHEVDNYDERIRLLIARVHCPMLRMAYLFECWQNDVSNSRMLYRPCVWCGIPTEKQCCMFLSECEREVCNDCKDRFLGCRRCTASVGQFEGLPDSLRAQWVVHAYRLAYGKDNPHDRDLGCLPPFYGNSHGYYPQLWFEELASQFMKRNDYWKGLL